MESFKRTAFGAGIDNVAKVEVLPEGAVRDMRNFDPHPSGHLVLRALSSQQENIENVRGGVVCQDGIIIVADDIRRFQASSGFSTVLGAAPDGDVVLGAELNGDVFLQVGVTQLRIRGTTVGPWSLPEISPQIAIAYGALPAGVYRVAVTAVDQFGAESGATPYIFTLTDNQQIQLSWQPPAGAVQCRVYASAGDGETLYLQSTAVDSFLLAAVRDDTARLLTQNMQQPPLASAIERHKGSIAMADRNVLWVTQPYSPHLVDFIAGFVSYDSDITMIQPVDSGIFVATENRTYFLRDFGLESMQQTVVAEIGAVRGSQVLLPDGRASWLTVYGQAFGAATGVLDLPQRQRYAPPIASSAKAGFMKHNGVELVVNTLHGAVNPNTLGVTDSFDLEID